MGWSVRSGSQEYRNSSLGQWLQQWYVLWSTTSSMMIITGWIYRMMSRNVMTGIVFNNFSMKIITIYFSIILFSLFSLEMVHAGPWIGGWGYGCNYGSADFITSQTPASQSYTKPQGINILCIAQSLQVFHADNGNAITSQEACPANPSRATSVAPLPALTAKDNICYTCTDSSVPRETAPAGSSTSCNTATPPVCTTTSWPATYVIDYTRACSDMVPWHHTIINGNTLYTSAWPWYAKNASCNPGNPTSPDTSLKVYQLKSETYMWDAVPPICARWGYFATLNRKDYISDDDLTGILLDMKNNSKDLTLSYIDDSSVYTGSWTYRNIQWKWICSDPDSGCPMPNNPFFSLPLNHLQKMFRKNLSDIVNNWTSAQCDSTVINPVSIKRLCYYNLKSEFITNFIAANSTTISGADLLKLWEIQGRINSLDATNFVADVRSLYEIAKAADPSNPHVLYDLVPNSCRYKLQFDGTPSKAPLIDKIKPTIGVVAKFWDGISSPDTLLEQEWTSMPWIPAIALTGSFLAGSWRITVNLTDSWGSSFTNPTIWNNYNGISGMSELFINICQTKTYSWEVMNMDCSNPSTSMIYQVALTATGYNSTGAVLSPNTWNIDIDLDDMSWIQRAGEYQVYIAVGDEAGNINTGSVTFDIIPEWFDPSKTELIKYNDPLDETFASVLYTNWPSGNIPGFATRIPTYANAIDAQYYKINVFDKYDNPIYDWKFYNFWLTQTGIYLDQVNKTGPSALFVDTVGGILSNSWQTATTDMNGSLKFWILSYTPGEFLEQFQFLYKKWDRWKNETWGMYGYAFPDMIFNSNIWTYNHIFTGAIELHTTNRIDLGTSNDIRLGFFATSSMPNPSLTLFKVNNFLESIQSLDPDNFTITSTGSYPHFLSFSSFYPHPRYLTGSESFFTPEQKGTIFSKNLEIITYPYITLTFRWQTTQYYASNAEDMFGSWLLYTTGWLNRIFIEWMTSMVGKNGYVATKDSLNLNSANTRNAIYKNVALLLRNRELLAWWWIINRVKYLVWDIDSTTLLDMDQWDTLIIKGWNFTIGDNYNDLTRTYPSLELRNYYFNSGSLWLDTVAHKGIIVLKDENGIGGNIYIKPDVRFIWASLFADESIESVKYSWNTFSSSNSARTVQLDKQLVIYGSVFSKNTVGGAVRANNNGWYVLPWNNTTISLDEAVRYDLAFLRMSNAWHDTASSMNRNHNEYVVILVDPRNISNTLPGFIQKQ